MNEWMIIIPLAFLVCWFYYFTSYKLKFLSIGLVPLNFGENSPKYSRCIAQKLIDGSYDTFSEFSVPEYRRKLIDTHLPSLQDIARRTLKALNDGEVITILTDGEIDYVWIEMNNEGIIDVCYKEIEDNVHLQDRISSCLYVESD